MPQFRVCCVRVPHPFAPRQQVLLPLLPFDLHVLSLPLAFILSQDQTLHCSALLSPVIPKDYSIGLDHYAVELFPLKFYSCQSIPRKESIKQVSRSSLRFFFLLILFLPFLSSPLVSMNSFSQAPAPYLRFSIESLCQPQVCDPSGFDPV